MLLNWVNDQSSFGSGFSKVVITSKASGAQGNNSVAVNNTESTQMVIDRMLAAFEASGFYHPALQGQNEPTQFSGLTARPAVRQSRNGPSSTASNADKAPHHPNIDVAGEDVPDNYLSESPEWVIELVNNIFAGLDDCYSALYYWKRPARETYGSTIHHTVSDPFFPQLSLSDAMKSRVQIGTVSKQGGSSGKSEPSDSSGKPSSDDSAWNRTTLPVTLSSYDDLAGY
ncbi:hypothetical protein VE02_04105 [Pseudogymnoascus sp. 03VT05]|nr:hypothetical protein VE02_04105 [Pseudogymnoascus sp. 03VT05]